MPPYPNQAQQSGPLLTSGAIAAALGRRAASQARPGDLIGQDAINAAARIVSPCAAPLALPAPTP